MFDIGFAELLVVGVMGLVVLGPEKLPTAARAVGLWVGRIRRSLGSIQREISAELRVDELRRTTSVTKDKLDEELSEMSKPFKKPFGDDSSANNAAKKSPKAESEPASQQQSASPENDAVQADESSKVGDSGQEPSKKQ